MSDPLSLRMLNCICRNRSPESTITIEYNVRSTSGVEQHCVPIGMSGKKVIIELRCEGRIGLPQ